MPKKERISQEDKSLFRDSVKGVKRIQSDTVAHKALPQVPQSPTSSVDEEEQPDWSDGHQSQWIEADRQLEWHKSGVNEKILRDLRTGKFPVAATLDLHGYTVESARLALARFLDQQSRGSRQCVCIVHGKGGRRDALPVLKNQVNIWLPQHPAVVAFSSSPPNYGGTGSVLVLIK